MVTVALIGPDGAGKTTVARRVSAALGRPAAYLYMGINAEASNVMLPTTRLILEVKRRRGGRPDLSGWRNPAGPDGTSNDPLAEIKSMARVTNQIAEEWFRQLVAWYHQLRGRIVIFDRHFYLDYHAYDVEGRHQRRRPLARRLHGLMLERLYPKPDLVILLDGPSELLLGRKGEGTLDSIDRRRSEYLALRDHVARFEVVDASRSVEEVTQDVAATIRAAHAEEGSS